jgi:CRISPR-associated protein Cas1
VLAAISASLTCKENIPASVLMTDDNRKTVLVAYQERKQEEIVHSFIDEKVTIGTLFHIQAMLMARYLRGDMDGYPPFIWK